MRRLATSALLVLWTSWCIAAQNGSPSTLQQADSPANQSAAGTDAGPKIELAKESAIRHLLEITGAGDLGIQRMRGMEASIRPLLATSLPPGEYREKLIELFFVKFHGKANAEQLVSLVIPIYDKYYSVQEINQLIQFYETPLGKKMVSVLPKISQESQDAGKEWGSKIGRESMEEVLAEHPDLAQALKDAKDPVFPK